MCPTKTPRSNCAYLTLFSDDRYLPGVLALAQSLRLVHSKYDLVVMHTASVSSSSLQTLAKHGCKTTFAEQFHPAGVDHSQYKRSLYLQCWNKLRMWEMEHYDRLAYLDADMLILRNVDHIFDLPHGFWAVGDCYGGRETAKERDSCPLFDCCPPAYFNAGFYVMSPSKQELQRMEAALAAGTCPVNFFAEQDFLNGFYAGQWNQLPYTFNAQKRIKFHHPEMWNLEEISVIHYVEEKPWDHRHSEENMHYQDIVELWWKVYETCGREVQHGGAAGGVGGKKENSGIPAPGTPSTADSKSTAGKIKVFG